VFIDLFVSEIDLGAVGDNQRELHSLRPWPAGLKQDALNAHENEFAHRAPVRSRLGFEPTVERRGDIDRGANGIPLHADII